MKNTKMKRANLLLTRRLSRERDVASSVRRLRKLQGKSKVSGTEQLQLGRRSIRNGGSVGLVDAEDTRVCRKVRIACTTTIQVEEIKCRKWLNDGRYDDREGSYFSRG